MYNRITICTLIILLAIIGSVSADTGNATTNTSVEGQHTVILQGGGSHPPTAYLGDTVDMSYVLGWSNTLAWWKQGRDPETTMPDITYTVSGFQHAVWLDPSKYKVGIWYKWDGAWESSGYNDAFEILSGIRPSPTPTPTPNITVINNTITKLAVNTTHIILTSNDIETYNYGYSDVGNQGDGHIWLFGARTGLYGDKMTSFPNMSAYSYTFNETESGYLQAGTYTGYIQLNGRNNKQDVFFDASSGNLSSQYRAIHDVNLSGLAPPNVKNYLDQIRNNTDYVDDLFIPITMVVENPTIRFTDYYERDDNVIISGTTSLASGTPISFIIDPDHWVTDADKLKNTVSVNVQGNIGDERTFTVSIPVKWDQLSLGEHTIQGSVNVNAISLKQEQIFEVTDIFVNPTQTPIAQKVIAESYGWHQSNVTNSSYVEQANGTIVLVPTVTPQVIYVNVTQIVYRTANITATPTGQPTDDASSPLPPEIGMLAVLVVAAYIVIKRN